VTVDGQNYFPDLADPTIRLALEYDGKVKYDQRDALYREKLREDALRSAGWTVIRFSARDLRDPHAIIMRIRATIRRLGAPTTSLLPVALHQFIGW
jgi:very-short-patch-repair endonuclease